MVKKVGVGMSNDKLQDDRRRGFYIVDNDIIDKYGKAIGAYGVAVYSMIARYADGNGENAFPSYQTMAEKLGMSRTKVVKTVELLVKLGLIKKEQRIDMAGDLTSNLYTIVHLGSTPHALPSTPHALQVVHHTYGGSTPHVLEEDTFNKTNKTKTKTTVAVVAKADEPIEGWTDVVSAYESNIGMFTAMSSDMVKEAVSEHGAVQIVDAIKEAVKNNVRKWSYVEGILRRWSANGKTAKTISPKAQTPKDEWKMVTNSYEGTKYLQHAQTGEKRPYVNA